MHYNPHTSNEFNIVAVLIYIKLRIYCLTSKIIAGDNDFKYKYKFLYVYNFTIFAPLQRSHSIVVKIVTVLIR